MLNKNVWIIDNFLEENTVVDIINSMSHVEIYNLDGKKEKHLVAPTYYDYNVHRDSIRFNDDLKSQIFPKLNSFYKSVINKTAKTDNLNPLQLFTKSFDPNKGYYDLHVEDPYYFGEIVFMIYLSDEQDGDLVIPSYTDAKKVWNEGFEEMTKKLSVEYAEETIRVKPKRNRAVFMKVGVAHYVEKCSGNRLCLSGWSFASDEYYNEFYGNN